MKPTEEQIAVIETDENQIVSAMAGTGKTATVLAHAAKRPDKKKLILFFNKSMADEMQKRAKALKIQNVDIRTSHSLAFREMNIGKNYEVGVFNAYEILKTVPKMSYSKGNMSLCAIALKLYTKWMSSVDGTWDETAKVFFRDPIISHILELGDEQKILKLVEHIDKTIRAKKLPMPHSLYLKWFQLQKKKLDYDLLYIDEFQDTAAVVLDIFRNQDMIKMAVGDSSQSCYGWNNAIDAMNKFPEFEQRYLTQSFRFPQSIADKANEVLSWKKYLGEDYYDPSLQVKGWHDPKPNSHKAILARTNSQIIGRAIQDVFDFGDYSRIAFEGNFDGYVNNGIVSIYDVLHLRNEKKDQIKSDFVHAFKDYSEFRKFADEHEDVDMLRTIGLVSKYGNNLFTFIPKLKEMSVSKDRAQMIYSTLHRAKGQEYSFTTILHDKLVTPASIKEKVRTKEGKLIADKDKLDTVNEAINLVYIGITRSMGKLNFKVEQDNEEEAEEVA